MMFISWLCQNKTPKDFLSYIDIKKNKRKENRKILQNCGSSVCMVGSNGCSKDHFFSLSAISSSSASFSSHASVGLGGQRDDSVYLKLGKIHAQQQKGCLLAKILEVVAIQGNSSKYVWDNWNSETASALALPTY